MRFRATACSQPSMRCLRSQGSRRGNTLRAPMSLCRRVYQPAAFLRNEDCRMAMLTNLLGLTEIAFDGLFSVRYDVHVGAWRATRSSGGGGATSDPRPHTGCGNVARFWAEHACRRATPRAPGAAAPNQQYYWPDRGAAHERLAKRPAKASARPAYAQPDGRRRRRPDWPDRGRCAGRRLSDATAIRRRIQGRRRGQQPARPH